MCLSLSIILYEWLPLAFNIGRPNSKNDEQLWWGSKATNSRGIN